MGATREAVGDPWRLGCPAEGHQSWEKRDDGTYECRQCEGDEAKFDQLRDLKEDPLE